MSIPLSRPNVVIDKNDNVYMIYRSDSTKNKMSALKLSAPYYKYNKENIKIIIDKDLGNSEPIIDRKLWDDKGILSMLI